MPIRIAAHPFSVRPGRLSNLSVSGAMIKADQGLRLLQRIQVAIEMPHMTPRCEAPIIAAYVTRSAKTGIGIEWCEFSPQVISDLLASLSNRRHVRLRKPHSTAAISVSRRSAPLLKHGG